GGYWDSGPPPQDRTWSVYGPRSDRRTARPPSRRPLQEPRAHLRRRLMSVAFTKPPAVVAVLELEQGHPQLLDGAKRAHPEQLLLERGDEPLGHPIALRLPHER